LARRAERIERPARVRMRSRKPWVFARRRFSAGRCACSRQAPSSYAGEHFTAHREVMCPGKARPGRQSPWMQLTRTRRRSLTRVRAGVRSVNDHGGTARHARLTHAFLWTAVEWLWTTLLACPVAGHSRERRQRLRVQRKPVQKHHHAAHLTQRSHRHNGLCSSFRHRNDPSARGNSLIHRLWKTCGQRWAGPGAGEHAVGSRGRGEQAGTDDGGTRR
jgi:hypothetical protein